MSSNQNGLAFRGEHCVLNGANFDIHVDWGVKTTRSIFTDKQTNSGNSAVSGAINDMPETAETSVGVGFRW